MATNFPDSPSNGTTHTFGGTTYTYNSTKGVWTAPGGGAGVTTFVGLSDTPANFTSSGGKTLKVNSGASAVEFATVSAGATVYANIDALPTSGNTQGDFAHVTSNNTLYFWNGSGWYKIAIINTSPSISGVSSSYNLATDGTATTITIVASDPEGLPITYSIASDTSGNTATVTQGTGASTNVWTITPSTNSAHAGSFSLTFRASDGVNLATAAASFSLVFNVQNQRYTTALITSVGANDATNKSFTDSSSNALTVTGYNGAHNTTFSPFRHGGHSVLLDGDDAIGVGVGSYALDWSDGQTWTIEFWMKRDGRHPDGHLFMKYPGGGSNISGLRVATDGTAGYIGLHYNGGTELTSSTSRADVADGDWHHVALTRGSGYFKIWVDGQLDATVSNTAADGMASTAAWAIGRHGSGTASAYLKDTLIRDFRIVGSEVYTSNFTPPTETLTAISGTQVLIANGLPYLQDSSSNGYALTYYGDPSIEGAGPHDKQAYVAATHSSSLRFDQASSNDYVIVANDNSAMDLGSAFTLECWFWTENSNTDVAIMQRGGGGSSAWSGTDGIYYGISFTSNKIAWISQPSGGSNQYMTGTTDIPLRRWNHVAVSYNGTTTSVYLNGKREATSTQSYNTPSSRGVFAVGTGTVSGAAASTNDYTGNIAEFRLSNSVRYDPSQTTLTIPTAPFTSDSNTGVLLKGGNGGIIDKSQSIRSIILQGDTKSSTTYTKYLSTSMKFDGTGDDIKLPQTSLNLSNSDFTVEAWVYTTSSANQGIVGSYRYADGVGAWHLNINYNSNKIRFFIRHSGGTVVDGQFESGTFPQNAWTHVAVTREGTNLRAFIDGTQAGSTNTSLGTASIDNAITNYYIGNDTTSALDFNGYMSDVRITKGLARYTANFTAPTAALQG